MLKLLWSWVLLVALAALVLLYQPAILTAKVDITVAGAKYAVHAWFLIFLVILLIITVLTIANFLFFWQRRLLIRKCKKLSNSIKAIDDFNALLTDASEEKQLLKVIKKLPLSSGLKTTLQKSLFKEVNSDGSLIALWWHGHWQRFSELICYTPIHSIWMLQACAHIYLQGGFQADMLPSFTRAWEQNLERIFQAFPTMAAQVQIKLFTEMSKSQLLTVWSNLPRKLRKQPSVVLAYVKALAQHEAWPEVQAIIDEYLVKDWDKFLGEWYFKSMPAKHLDIPQLQKWYKQSPIYIRKAIMFALARAHAEADDWIVVRNLIDKIADQELTFALELAYYAKQDSLPHLKKLISSNLFSNFLA